MLVEFILLLVMRISLNAAIVTTPLASALAFRFTDEDNIFYLLDRGSCLIFAIWLCAKKYQSSILNPNRV